MVTSQLSFEFTMPVSEHRSCHDAARSAVPVDGERGATARPFPRAPTSCNTRAPIEPRTYDDRCNCRRGSTLARPCLSEAFAMSHVSTISPPGGPVHPVERRASWRAPRERQRAGRIPRIELVEHELAQDERRNRDDAGSAPMGRAHASLCPFSASRVMRDDCARRPSSPGTSYRRRSSQPRKHRHLSIGD
jgi:hypothetical protein